MKRTSVFSLPLVFLLSLLFSFACQEESSLIAPDNAKVSSEEPNWVGLPTPKYQRLSKSFNAGDLIKKDEDGELIIDESYESVDGNTVKVIAKLKLYKGTIDEDTYIAMAVDGETGVLTFTPHMDFNMEAELYVKIEGFNLDGVQIRNLDFLYLTNSNYESVDHKEIIVDESSGLLELKEGKVPHFSRYGFTK